MLSAACLTPLPGDPTIGVSDTERSVSVANNIPRRREASVVALGASFTGWYIGTSIGFAVVTVVALLVAMILMYAARIRDQAIEGIARMDMARSNTDPVWRLQDINVATSGIWRSAEKARKLLEGGS
jgi:hypothetical protein